MKNSINILGAGAMFALSMQISILRQPKPYGDCKRDWSETPYHDVVKTAPFIQDIPYSQGVEKINF